MMANGFHYSNFEQRSRWKLFTAVMFLIGVITAAAITLLLMANPPHGGLYIPTINPLV